MFFWADAGARCWAAAAARRLRGGCAAASASRSGFGDFAGGGI